MLFLRTFVVFVFVFSLVGVSGSFGDKIKLDKEYLDSLFFKTKDSQICFWALNSYNNHFRHVHKLVKYKQPYEDLENFT